jgi:1,4-dihydroxy-2-naphthoate octaprenyltransferase
VIPSTNIISSLEKLSQPILGWIDNNENPHSVFCDVTFDDPDQITVQIPVGIRERIGVSTKVRLLFHDVESTKVIEIQEKLSIFGYVAKLKENSITIKIDYIENHLEQKLDFLSYIQKEIPSSNDYLSEYNRDLAHRIIRENQSALLVSTSGGGSSIRRIQFVSDINHRLYFIGKETEPPIKHININSQVKLLFNDTGEYQPSGDIVLDGRIRNVSLDQLSLEAQESIFKLSSNLNKNQVEEKNQYTIAVIEPLQLRYGSFSQLESYRFPNFQRGLYQDIWSSFKEKIRFWIGGMRMQFFPTSLFPILLVTAGAYHNGYTIDVWYLLLVLCGIFCIYGGTNLLNDYFDHASSSDEINVMTSSFAGGSKYIQTELATPSRMFTSGIMLLTLGGSIGIYLNSLVEGNTLLTLGLIGVTLAYFYSGEPFKLAYKSFGDIAIIIALGPVPAFGAFFVQTETLHGSKLVFFISLLFGLLAASIQFLNDIQSADFDDIAGKRTFVVRIGKEKSSYLFSYVVAFYFAGIFFGIVIKQIPFISIVSLITAPVAWRITKKVKQNYFKPSQLTSLIQKMILLYVVTNSLLLTGILL